MYAFYCSEMQGVAKTGRNRTGPPCSVGRPSADRGAVSPESRKVSTTICHWLPIEVLLHLLQ